MLLEKALPEKEKRRIQVAQRQGEQISCQGFLSQLGARFGTTKENMLRKKWQELALKHSGKLSVQDLHDFELDFKQVRQDLNDLTDRECREHLLKKLPKHLTGWVVEQEGRLRTEKPQVLFSVGSDYPVSAIAETVRAYAAVEPTKVVKVKPREFLLQFTDQTAVKKMMELDGVVESGVGKPTKVREVDQMHSVDQMFDLVTAKLEGRDRADQYCRGDPPIERYRSPTRDPRYVRIADREDQEEREARGRETGKSPPRSPPPPKNDNKRPSSPRPSSPAAPKGESRNNTPPKSWNGRQRTGQTPNYQTHPNQSGWWNAQGQKGKGKGGKGGKGKGQNQNWGRGRGVGSGKLPPVFWFWDDSINWWNQIPNSSWQGKGQQGSAQVTPPQNQIQPPPGGFEFLKPNPGISGGGKGRVNPPQMV